MTDPHRPPPAARRLSTTAAVLLTLGGAAAGVALTTGAVLYSGLYDISANAQHTQAMHTLLEKTMHRSVRRYAASIQPPALDVPALRERGAACYVAKCVQCHGGPGVAQADIGRSMQPLPGPLVDAARRWQAQELYWITRNGIKMSGMPAWQYRLGDDDLWALVAFMQQLPSMTAGEFGRLLQAPADAACTPAADPPPVVAQTNAQTTAQLPSAERGQIALTQYACTACHVIPGVTGSDVHVGPPLAGLARRGLVAGAVPNTADNLVRWIRDPRSIDPETTMPDMQVQEADAHDMAAYLATLQ